LLCHYKLIPQRQLVILPLIEALGFNLVCYFSCR